MTVVPSCSYLASVHICVHIGCFLSRGLPKVISTAVEFQFFMLVLTALFYVVDYAGSATVQARAEPPELSSAYFKSTGAQVLTSAKDGCCDCGRTRWSAYTDEAHAIVMYAPTLQCTEVEVLRILLCLGATPTNTSVSDTRYRSSTLHGDVLLRPISGARLTLQLGD